MTDDAIHRHQCEVRFLVRSRNDPGKGGRWVREFLADPKVSGRRKALADDLNDQLQKGNTGGDGEWK